MSREAHPLSYGTSGNCPEMRRRSIDDHFAEHYALAETIAQIGTPAQRLLVDNRTRLGVFCRFEDIDYLQPLTLNR